MWNWIAEWFVWFKARILEALAWQQRNFTELKKGQDKIMAKLDEILAKVRENNDVVDYAIVLLQEISLQLREALADNDPVKAQEILRLLKLVQQWSRILRLNSN